MLRKVQAGMLTNKSFARLLGKNSNIPLWQMKRETTLSLRFPLKSMNSYSYRDILMQRDRSQILQRKALPKTFNLKFCFTFISLAMELPTTDNIFYSMKNKSRKYFGLLKQKLNQFLQEQGQTVSLQLSTIAVERT